MQATCTDQAVLSCGAVCNVIQGGFKVAPLDFLGGKLYHFECLPRRH